MARVSGTQKTDRNGKPAARRSSVCPGCGYRVQRAPYCPNCGLRVTATRPDLPTSARADVRARSRPPRRGLVRFATLLAVAGLAAGVAGLVLDRPRSDTALRTQVAQLQQALARADHRLASDGAAIDRLSTGSRRGLILVLRNELQRVTTCVPQLMAYVNGLSVIGSWVPDKRGDQLLKYPAGIHSGIQLSRSCASWLYAP